MYPTVSRAVALLTAVQEGVRRDFARHADRPLPRVIVCPPFPCLPILASLRDSDVVRLGAQNCHWEASGPYTGEVAPTMLAEMADYVLLGHSDRRAAGETDEQIAKKVRAAAVAGLTPVLFVGEDEPTDAAVRHTERRLLRGLSEVDLATHHVVVVYEPTWAVGADEPAAAEHVRQVVAHLKSRMRELGAARSEIIYGGTVTADNVGRFADIDLLDGVGATRATLDERGFLRIIDVVTRIGSA